MSQAVGCQLSTTEARVRVSVRMGDAMDKVATGKFLLPDFRHSLSVSFHRCTTFTQVSSGRRIKGPLDAHFHLYHQLERSTTFSLPTDCTLRINSHYFRESRRSIFFFLRVKNIFPVGSRAKKNLIDLNFEKL